MKRWFSAAVLIFLLFLFKPCRIAAQSDPQHRATPEVHLAGHTGQAPGTQPPLPAGAAPSLISPLPFVSAADPAVLPAVTNPAGIVYTCDSSISASICQTLNTTIASLYRNNFTNANASIYITFGNTGLGQSVYAVFSVSYSSFVPALLASATSANDQAVVAKGLPASSPFGNGFVSLTNANARVLGFAPRSGLLSDGVTSCSLSASNCYDGVITIGSSLNNAGQLYFRTGPPINGSQYDFYTTVEHETDEILGTASCAFGCSGSIAPTDLFRYHSNGDRTFQAGNNTDSCLVSSALNACFSIDGIHMLQQYNNIENGEDAGDWLTNCSSPLVQDAEGCLSVGFVDLSATKEVALLDVIGFTLVGSAQSPTATTSAASSITASTATLGGSVNPNGADTHAWFNYSSNSSLIGSTSTPQQDLGSGGSSVAVSANLTTLSPSTTYYFQVVASSSIGTNSGAILSFTTPTLAQPPSVATAAASSITSSSGTMNGNVNPNSLDTHVWFVYSTNSALSGGISTAQQDIGAGNSNLTVSANLNGLAASTSYYFQVRASNTAGTSSGTILSFTTSAAAQPPTVSTSAASSVSSTAASLNGTANPNGLDTHVWFSYSANSSMSGSIATAQQDIGSGTAAAVSAVIAGLAPGTTYYYQIWSSNSAGTSQGAVTSFTTQTPALPDLAVSALTAPNTGSPGGAMNVSMTVANQGSAPAGAFRVEFYFSSTANISTSATDSGYGCSFNGLGSGGSTSCTAQVTIPGGLAPGSWFFGAIADPNNQVLESNEANNARAADSGPISVSSPGVTLSGNISLAGAGVTVTLSGSQTASTNTDGGGNYSFSLPAGANVTVTPAKNGYIFSPISQSVVLNTNQTVNFTALAIQNQVPRAVFRDTHGAIGITTYASSSLSSAGGVFASDPSAAEDLNGNIFVTARDNFNSVWANVYNSGSATWTGWTFGGGVIQGIPAVVVDTTAKAWIASRDAFNAYWLVSYTNAGGFSPWTSLQGVFSTDPVMASCRDGSMYLLGKDNFNSLWSGHFIPGSGFQGWQFGGGVIKDKPSATCGGDNALYIAAEDNYNSNWIARVSGNTWTGWFFGGAVTSVPPRIVGLGNGREAVMILDASNAVWTTTFAEGTGNGWAPWTSVGGVLQDVSAAAANSQLYLAGRAFNGDLWWWQQPGNQWTWIGNGGVAAGALSATPRRPAKLHAGLCQANNFSRNSSTLSR